MKATAACSGVRNWCAAYVVLALLMVAVVLVATDGLFAVVEVLSNVAFLAIIVYVTQWLRAVGWSSSRLLWNGNRTSMVCCGWFCTRLLALVADFAGAGAPRFLRLLRVFEPLCSGYIAYAAHKTRHSLSEAGLEDMMVDLMQPGAAGAAGAPVVAPDNRLAAMDA